MRRSRDWQLLRSLGLEFWLPLPLIGLAFWIASGFVTEYSLNFADPSVESFTVALNQNQSSNEIVYIKARVDRNRGTSQISVKQATQTYKRQEFELKTTNLEQMETAIGKKLKLSPGKVRQLLRYQIKE